MGGLLAGLPGWVAELLSTLAVAILKEVLARDDLKDKVRLQMENQGLKDAILALNWEQAAAGSPSGGGDLRVRAGSEPISVQSGDPSTGSGPR